MITSSARKMRRKHRLSVVIPTFNCKEKLKRCLESVKWADEIVIVDMSTDDTLSVARKYTKKIYKHPFPKNGNFDYNRKFGMQHSSGDWIMKLDSDEIISPGLQEELKNFLLNPTDIFDGFNFYNKIYMLGKRIEHGFVKKESYELRLVRKDRWIYEPYRYHQTIKVKGNIGFFKNSYDHYVFDTIGEFIQKTNKYTDLDSKYFSETHRVNILTVGISPWKSFLKLYFFQLGFLDGTVGLVVCILFSMYNLLEKLKAWHLQKFRII